MKYMSSFIYGLIRKTKWYRELKIQDGLRAEILRAQIFNNTITGSEWLKYKSFSPGEWAAGYGLLYTIYRSLSSVKPSSLVEFGLGQSSKMIHQYADFYRKEAVTIEHDKKWVDFFESGREGEYPIPVRLVDLETIAYKGQETVTYKDIDKVLEGKKFDFVLVDGPFGSDRYSRSEVINVAMRNLADDFCIILDDTDRSAEMETACEVMDVLKEAGVSFCHTTYKAAKHHTLVCSPDWKFLTSL